MAMTIGDRPEPEPNQLNQELAHLAESARKGRRARKVEQRPRIKHLRRYLSLVLQTHDRMRFGDPTAQNVDTVREAPAGRMSLSDVYTPLFVTYEKAGERTSSRQDGGKGTLVEEALRQEECHRAVLLGEPGAGKSTFINRFMTNATRQLLAGTEGEEGGQPRIPIHIQLSAVDPHSGDWLPRLLSGGEEIKQAGPEAAELLVAALDAGEAFLLLDGLDEVVEESALASIIDMIQRAGREYPLTQMLITCRTYDYLIPEPNRKLPYPILRLLPFALTQMLDYVERWYNTLRRLGILSDAPERRRNLQDSLRSNPDLTQLAETPLLLTLMALVHTIEGELPKTRSVLYYRAICHMLTERPQWRRGNPGLTLPSSDLVPLASEIAFDMHQTEQNAGEGFQGIPLPRIEELVAQHVGLQRFASMPAEYSRARRKQQALVERLVDSNGLVVDQGVGNFDFSHRSFREFLAGFTFLNGSQYEEALALAKHPHWHMPLVLMAGYGAREGQSLFFLVQFLGDLHEMAGDRRTPSAQSGSSGWVEEVRMLVGEMLVEIGRDALSSKGHTRVLHSEGKGFQAGLWPQVRNSLFSQSQEAGLPISVRVRTFEILGQLDDPRLTNDRGEVLPLGGRLVRLPAASLRIGAAKDTVEQGRSAPVEPVREIEFAPFSIGLYSVTNIEFAQFIDAGGYGDIDHWNTDAARRWLQGDATFLAELVDKAMATFDRDFAPELQTETYRRQDLVDNVKSMTYPRREPFFWRNSRFNRPTQPVVGINWWEARAYCSWLSAELAKAEGVDVIVRLPTEWEWERAAKGEDDERLYPWGNDPPSARRVHTRFEGLGFDHAIPVGCLLEGTYPGGPLDMCGNVWEWTGSLAVGYEAQFDRVREREGGIDERIVRGGSWFSDAPHASRCAYRGVDPPQNVYFDLGFRVVADTAHGMTMDGGG